MENDSPKHSFPNLREAAKKRAGETTAVDFLFPDRSAEIEKYERFKDAIASAGELCAKVKGSDDPRKEIQNALEILIQRGSDPNWISDEADADPRMVFFLFYFDATAGKLLSSEDILKELQEHRFDAGFYNNIVSSLADIEQKAHHFLRRINGDLGREREWQQKRQGRLSQE